MTPAFLPVGLDRDAALGLVQTGIGQHHPDGAARAVGGEDGVALGGIDVLRLHRHGGRETDPGDGVLLRGPLRPVT